MIKAWLRWILAHLQQHCSYPLQAQRSHWSNLHSSHKTQSIPPAKITLLWYKAVLHNLESGRVERSSTSGPTKVMTRMTVFMRYSFSPDSGFWKAPKRLFSKGISCACRSLTEKRWRPFS